MFHTEDGIICGSDGGKNEYAPVLETLKDDEKRFWFSVLVPRGGDKTRNYDVFRIKVLGKLADDYAQRFANDAMKGHTVRLQMQIKVSDFGQIEMICQYIQFDLGMNIVLDNCPEFAKKDACSCVVDKQKNNNTTQKATKEKEVVKKEKSIENTAPVEEVPFVDATTSKQSDEKQSEEVNDDFVLELTQLSQNIPIIVCETTKEYINGVIKNKASQKPSSNNPNSRDSEDYAVFRSLMKNI